MTPRLTSDMIVGALLRQVDAAGGIATVLAKGDPGAGDIVVVIDDRQAGASAWECGRDAAGRPALVSTGPTGDSVALDQYLARRRDRDRDLWLIELNVAEAKRFAADALCAN